MDRRFELKTKSLKLEVSEDGYVTFLGFRGGANFVQDAPVPVGWNSPAFLHTWLKTGNSEDRNVPGLLNERIPLNTAGTRRKDGILLQRLKEKFRHIEAFQEFTLDEATTSFSWTFSFFNASGEILRFQIENFLSWKSYFLTDGNTFFCAAGKDAPYIFKQQEYGEIFSELVPNNGCAAIAHPDGSGVIFSSDTWAGFLNYRIMTNTQFNGFSRVIALKPGQSFSHTASFFLFKRRKTGSVWQAVVDQIYKHIQKKKKTISVKHFAFSGKPDFQTRAVHVHIGYSSRFDRETRYRRLKMFIEKVMPEYKFNTLLLELDQGFQFKNHPEMNDRKVLTHRQAKEIVALAAENNIEIIPEYNTFGHQGSAEIRIAGAYPQLVEGHPGSYCPAKPEVYKLHFEMFEEILDVFHPGFFHIGHDEIAFGAITCPKCRSRRRIDLYEEDILKYYEFFKKKGVRIIIWGDLLWNKEIHRYYRVETSPVLEDPEEVCRRLPKDIIICDWNYEPCFAKFPSVDYFRKFGFDVWPALCVQATREKGRFETNIAHFSTYAKKRNLSSIVLTTWSLLSPEKLPLSGIVEAGLSFWKVNPDGWRNSRIFQDEVNHLRQSLGYLLL